MVLSSIFGKTKPINFVLVFAYMLIFFLISFFFYLDGDHSLWSFLKKTGSLGLLIFSVFLIDFISKKNNLSRNNSYVILLFVLLISMFPQALLFENSIFSNCFVLLAARKCLSMKSKIDMKRKIFDASFWIGIATLFCNWSILVLILVYITIIFYDAKDYKNWLIPIIAFLTVGVLTTTYLVLTDTISYFRELLVFDIYLRIVAVTDVNYLIPFIFIMSIGLISLLAFFIKIKAKTSKTQTSIFLVTILLIIAIAIALLSGNRGGSEFLFIAFPMAVIVTNYLELIVREWYKEVILWIFFLMPMLLLVL